MLPDFVFVAPNKSAPEMGAGYILSTKPPFHLGKIIKLPCFPYSVFNYVFEKKPHFYCELVPWSIVIVFSGNLFGLTLLKAMGAQWQKETQNTYNRMGDWFITEKIYNNRKY